MRVLERNKRAVHYINPTGGETELKDENGFYTGEYAPEYTEDAIWRVNWAVSIGSPGEYVDTFGKAIEYDCVMVSMDCPLVEGSIVTADRKYEVKKIVQSLNGYVIALKGLIE